ncbi:chemotaxis protein CheW [Desulfohalovibrio reitneri]|uniref:chemotaxis protein CheW n=1 Tax=Desulfohalovibrio reitneri TaxID=1307759 RepID=UPI0009DD0BEC|nr:chemotaxis protein CheW [Desulfohalovibrio reitneri]
MSNLDSDSELVNLINTDEEGRGGQQIRQLVTFSIGDEEFGIDILKVQEIIRMVDITRVPKAPDFVEGVINLRGKVIPVIDLRKRFGMPGKDHDKNTRCVVVDICNMIVGFIVDSVSEVLRIPSDTIEPPPPVVAGIESEYINGVGKLEDRLLILLDLNKLLSTHEMEQLATC